jgi:hypothetical protein
MARYIVIRVESAQTAETLLERFAVVPAIKTVGLFASPSSFCEGDCPSEGKSVRSRKWGLWFCPICKKPKQGRMHQPRNLLQPLDLHPKFADFFISVWEPFTNEANDKYGANAIERTRQNTLASGERLKRRKRRNRRRNTDG